MRTKGKESENSPIVPCLMSWRKCLLPLSNYSTWETCGDRSSCFPGGGRPIWRSPSCRRRHRPPLRWFRAALCPWSRRPRGSGREKRLIMRTRYNLTFLCSKTQISRWLFIPGKRNVTQWRKKMAKWPKKLKPITTWLSNRWDMTHGRTHWSEAPMTVTD